MIRPISLIGRKGGQAPLFQIDRQILDVLDLGTVNPQDGVETEFYFSGHFASVFLVILRGRDQSVFI